MKANECQHENFSDDEVDDSVAFVSSGYKNNVENIEIVPNEFAPMSVEADYDLKFRSELELLLDYNLSPCARVGPIKVVGFNGQSEQTVFISSSHMAWFMSSNFILTLLNEGSGAVVVLKRSFDPSQISFISVGGVDSLSKVLRKIRELLMNGPDRIISKEV